MPSIYRDKGGETPQQKKNQIKIFVSEHGVSLVGYQEKKTVMKSICCYSLMPDTGTWWCVHRKSVVLNVSLLNISLCTCSSVCCAPSSSARRRGEGGSYKPNGPVCLSLGCLVTHAAAIFRCQYIHNTFLPVPLRKQRREAVMFQCLSTVCTTRGHHTLP